MRNPLKRHPSTEPKPSLRERLGAMKAKAAGLGSGADKGRRAMLAGALAATVPLPVLAASEQPSEREVAFLALAPEILPLLRRYEAADSKWHSLSRAAEAAAGVFPGWHNDEAGCVAWNARITAERQANGSSAALCVVNDLDRLLGPLVNPFINDPMHTLPGIMLKAALNHLGEWWGESALADLSRLAAEAFGLPAPAPFFQELVAPDDEDADEDDTSSAETA